VLQAADILLYKGQAVPIGQDQLPHLEITREIARRFNHLYGRVFPEPEALLTATPKLPGVDGRKMSKSYDNCLYLSDEDPAMRKKIKRMMTDPQKIKLGDPGRPEICPVYAYHQVYNSSGTERVAVGCRTGSLACVACKEELADHLVERFRGWTERRREWMGNPQKIDAVLEEGAAKARVVARSTMAQVYQAVYKAK